MRSGLTETVELLDVRLLAVVDALNGPAVAPNDIEIAKLFI